jgi:hypothetical protein
MTLLQVLHATTRAGKATHNFLGRLKRAWTDLTFRESIFTERPRWTIKYGSGFTILR